MSRLDGGTRHDNLRRTCGIAGPGAGDSVRVRGIDDVDAHADLELGLRARGDAGRDAGGDGVGEIAFDTQVALAVSTADVCRMVPSVSKTRILKVAGTPVR